MSKATKRTEVTSSAARTLCPRLLASKHIMIILLLSVIIYGGFHYAWNNHPKTFRKLITAKLRRNQNVTSPQIHGNVFLLILINSIPKTATRRQLLRETWAGTANTNTLAKSSNTRNDFNNDLQVFCVFLVGVSDNPKENKDLIDESYIHGDVLQIITQESYRNMINKIWAGFRWARKHNPKYLMKVDDDIYVDIPHLITFLHEKELPDNFYTGWVLHQGRVMRSPGNQWFVSHSEFIERYFPDYCIGPFYIFSGSLLGKLIRKSKVTKMFSVEDAYLGVLMRSIHIAPIYNNEIFVWDPSLTSKLQSWEESKYRKVICLGERLKGKTIRLIHMKYQAIKKADGKL